MKLLFVTFYYPPDLSAGSFRAAALVEALLEKLPGNLSIDIVTTLPNRYSSFSSEAVEFEEKGNLSIYRIRLPSHHGGMLDQSKAFFEFFNRVRKFSTRSRYDVVYATSSRLMTAVLGAWVSRRKNTKFYLDIRDIFVETMEDILSGKMISLFASPVFSLLERWAISKAEKVNLVSEGFRSYFEARYPEKKFSFFTNGIDEEFMRVGFNVEPRALNGNEPVKVLYAGNIGEGQGLHTIIPELAKRLSGKAEFKIIGDGGRKAVLESRIRHEGVGNVILESPISRDSLIECYKEADILFLHLNDYKAFKRVLPSKLFEYAAMGKPVWAGVAGFAAGFVRANISNAVVFPPGDAIEAERVFARLQLKEEPRTDFLCKFSRKKIMDKMAGDVLSVVEGC